VPVPGPGGEYAAAYWDAAAGKIGNYSLPTKLG
jgi:hypothetical protein